MRIGIVGLGKLGFPVAVAMALKGHDVMGYDINPDRMNHEMKSQIEAGPDGSDDMRKYLEFPGVKSSIKFGELADVVNHSDIVFIAVQTPHDRAHGGTEPYKGQAADFDYTFLKDVIRSIADVMTGPRRPVTVISTCLPGTIRREILPLANNSMAICYNPFFIAMGTTMRDFLNPEFVLIGADEKDEESVIDLEIFYKAIHDRPTFKTSIENAELIKVAYNTYIGQKIVFANTMMEICHDIPGCDVDAITDGLSLATDRIISPAYMRGGLGDGGGCHPRDNIAMSWLAKKCKLSFNLFESIMQARDVQTYEIAKLARRAAAAIKADEIVVLGTAYKPETNLTDGSPAILLANMLSTWVHPKTKRIDPFANPDRFDEFVGRMVLDQRQRVFIIGTKHKQFTKFQFPEGSVVIDPWRYITPRAGVEVIHLGVGVKSNGGISGETQKPSLDTMELG